MVLKCHPRIKSPSRLPLVPGKRNADHQPPAALAALNVRNKKLKRRRMTMMKKQ
jgi:hypothetical protein